MGDCEDTVRRTVAAAQDVPSPETHTKTILSNSIFFPPALRAKNAEIPTALTYKCLASLQIYFVNVICKSTSSITGAGGGAY